MSDSIKLKNLPTAVTPATAPAAKPVTPVPAPPRLPELNDSPRFTVATANLNRLKAEEARLERAFNDHQAARAESIAEKRNSVEAVLRGKSPADARREAAYSDTDAANVYADLRAVRRAIEMAEKEVAYATGPAKHEACAPFAAQHRKLTRVAALAYIAAARAFAPLDAANEHLQLRELAGYGGCVPLLPRFRDGDPSDPTSHVAFVLRDLLDAGVLDATKDAEILAGLAVAPPRPVYVEPAPKPKPKKEPGAMARALKSLGVSFGSEW